MITEQRYVRVPVELIDTTQLEMDENLSKMHTSAKWLYVLLAYHRNYNKKEAWPGQDTLAQLIGCKERNIRRLLNELKDAGFIIAFRDGRGTKYTFPHLDELDKMGKKKPKFLDQK